MATKGKCEQCPLSFFAYHWNRTRCKAHPESLTTEQILEMYKGCTNENGVYIYPDWCPKLKYVHVKY